MSEIMTYFEIPEPIGTVWMTTFQGRVYPLSRPRFSKGHAYQPLQNQRELRNHVFEHRPSVPIDSDIWLDCLLFSTGGLQADADNLFKSIFDALQASGVLVNDRQIVGGMFQRGISDCDHCHIILREVSIYVHGAGISS